MGSRPSPFKGQNQSFLSSRSNINFALVVHSVGVSKYGHYTAHAQESLLNAAATNKAFSF